MLRLAGTEVGPGNVRGVWVQRGVETVNKRLTPLEQLADSDMIIPSKTQTRLFECQSVECLCSQLAGSRIGELLNRDTICAGIVWGVGKVCAQVVVAKFRSRAFARV